MKVISSEKATPQEMKNSSLLLEVFSPLAGVLSSSERDFQKNVVKLLESIVGEWMKTIPKPKVNSTKTSSTTFLLETAGSYRLGTTARGCDIDMVLIVPSYVFPSNFFQGLKDILLQNACVSDLRAIPNAFVPVLKFTFNGIPIDLLFARLSGWDVLSKLNIENDAILHYLDDYSQRAINSPRVAMDLLRIVPNVQTFQNAALFIKHWAKKRHIYGNQFGYPGGIAWSILVARVCVLYPNFSVIQIIYRFFWIYSGWKWPNPVILRRIERKDEIGFDVWDMSKIQEEDNVMPIITPTYPCMNSTHNVSKSQLRIVQEELGRAKDMFVNVLMENLQRSNIERTLGDLFSEEEGFFFHRYKNFIEISTKATNKLDFVYYSAFLDSKMRKLGEFLVDVNKNLLVHIYPESFKNPEGYLACCYIGLDYEKRTKGTKKSIDVTSAITKFQNYLLEMKLKSTYTKDMPQVEIRILKQFSIPDYVNPPKSTKKQKQRMDLDPSELVAPRNGNNGGGVQKRKRVMEKTGNGFDLKEKDSKIRKYS